LRKFLIAAIAALASIALASVAIAQTEDVTSTSKLTPSKAGTKKKPRAAKLHSTIVNNVPNTTAATIEIDFPKTVKISGKGLKHCAVAEFSKPGGKDNCPAKSKAGTGFSNASVGSGPGAVPLDFNVTSYVAGNNLLVFYIEQKGGGIVKALQGKISRGSGKFGQKLVITIPEDLRKTAAGYGNLEDLESTLYNKKGKHSLISTIGCKKKKHTFGAKFTFVPNPGPPPKPSASGTSTATCK